MNILEPEWLSIHLALGLLSAWGVYPCIFLRFISVFFLFRLKISWVERSVY
jgi:hypothetical protein